MSVLIYLVSSFLVVYLGSVLVVVLVVDYCYNPALLVTFVVLVYVTRPSKWCARLES